MEKLIENGTKVIIFKDSDKINGDYTFGTVVSSHQSDDRSVHGSPWYVQIYEVVDIDGRKYSLERGDSFMPLDDYKSFLVSEIEDNNEQIKELTFDNEQIFERIYQLDEDIENIVNPTLEGPQRKLVPNNKK